jgi:hypothetical protein
MEVQTLVELSGVEVGEEPSGRCRLDPAPGEA